MKRQILAVMVLLTLVACNNKKKNDTTLEAANKARDSKAQLDAKKAAEAAEAQAAEEKRLAEEKRKAEAARTSTASPQPRPTPAPTPAPAPAPSTQPKPESASGTAAPATTPATPAPAATSTETTPAATPAATATSENKETKTDTAASTATATTGETKPAATEEKTDATAAVKTDADADKRTEGSVLVLKERYQSEMLDLRTLEQNKGHFGILTLRGEDAQVLFNSLKVASKKFPDNEQWEKQEFKRGKDVSCFIMKAKAKDGKDMNECNLYLRYHEGLVMQHVEQLKEEASAAKEIKEYMGKSLQIGQEENLTLASILLRGKDAEILYKVMAVPAKTSATSLTNVATSGSAQVDSMNVKMGQALLCTQTNLKPDAKSGKVTAGKSMYDCELELEATKGEARLRMDVSEMPLFIKPGT